MASAFARWRVSLIVWLLLGTGAVHAAFDKPLKMTVVQVTRAPARTAITVSCFYYATFMVKVLKGDPRPSAEDASAVVPGRMPACRDLSDADYSAGYYTGYGPFKGVKGGFVFFDSGGPDAQGGRGFVVVNGAGRRVMLDWKIGEFQSVGLVSGGIVLRYRRMFPYHCSLYYGAATACWGEIKGLTALTDASTPDCRAAYDDEYRTYRKKWPRDAARVKSFPADISYNVEARYDGNKVSYTPLPGPVDCGPGY